MLVLGRVDGEPSRTPECYRSGVRGRFICLGRWPEEPSNWCSGCIERSFDPGKLAGQNSGPAPASTGPDRGHQPSGGR